jgi:hypothetical protein
MVVTCNDSRMKAPWVHTTQKLSEGVGVVVETKDYIHEVLDFSKISLQNCMQTTPYFF